MFFKKKTVEDIYPEYELFFAPIANAIVSFVKKHRLKLEKYEKESPAWGLSFRHPLKGIASIGLYREEDQTLSISKIWTYDDYDKGSRSLKYKIKEKLARDPHSITVELENAFQDILSWKFGDWDTVNAGLLENWHKNWTKSQFNNLEKEYPFPK